MKCGKIRKRTYIRTLCKNCDTIIEYNKSKRKIHKGYCIKCVSVTRRLNLTDQKFGHLTVIKQMPVEKRQTRWLCQCSCGNTSIVAGGQLTSGKSKSCGCAHGLTLKEYIKSKVTVGKDGKWLWNGLLDKNNYGRGSFNGKQWRASRLSYTAFIGDIPDGMLVCHKNDCPQDVNPKNLFLGSPSENSMDMVKKGRSLQGVKNHEATITEEDVIEIKRMLSEGIHSTIIEKKFGISKHIVSLIKTGRTWKHVE
jgi:hypothetical protein